MTDEQNKHAQVLFADAVELPSAERDAFVRAKTGDAEVLSRVLHLLEDERLMGGFMDTLTAVKDPAALPTRSGRVFTEGQIVAGRYRIVRLIAFGGMGEVYEAYDLTLDLRVALKTILPAIACDEQVMGRFRREVKLTRKIGNRNVCRIFDIGQHTIDTTAVAFLSMEYLEGETLAEHIKARGRFTPDEALPLIRQMAEALEATHASGIIHRDFKPSNVMLVPEEGGTGKRVVVTDFGLACTPLAKEGSTALTESRQILGTPDYMAPEQLMAGKATPATDVYALGLVIYEMVTEHRPFEIPNQRLIGTPTPMRNHAPELDENWGRVIEWCLAKNPEQRPQSPLDVVRALEGDAVAAPPRESEVRAAAVSRRWALAAIFILVTLAAQFLRLPGLERFAPADAGTKHVAVLPFRVSDEELRVFADGLMEAITSRLSQYEGMNETLLVVPPSEVARQGVASASGAYSKLGANSAVEGRLYSEGDRLRLILTLNQLQNVHQTETVMVEGTRAKALRFQDDTVEKLVNALNLTVQPQFVAELNKLAPVEPAAYDFYVQGLGYVQRNDRLADIDTSIALFKRAIQLDSGFALAHAALGGAYLYKYLRSGDARWIDDASAAAKNGVEYGSQLAEAHITLGRVYNETGRYDEAVHQFSVALEIEARNGAAFEGLGQSYTKLNKTGEAAATYQAMISRRSNDWRAYHQLGLFYKRQGDFPSAIREYQKVISLTPDNAMAYSNLGTFYYLNGQLRDSKRAWEKSTSLAPTKAALSNLAKLYLDDNNLESAVRAAEEATKLGEDDYRIWNILAVAYRRSGREGDATNADRKSTELAERILSRNGNHLDALTHLAFNYAFLGNRSRATEMVSRLIEVADGGNDPEIFLSIARVYVKLGDDEKATRYLRLALQHGAVIKTILRDTVLSSLVGPQIHHDNSESTR